MLRTKDGIYFPNEEEFALWLDNVPFTPPPSSHVLPFWIILPIIFLCSSSSRRRLKIYFSLFIYLLFSFSFLFITYQITFYLFFSLVRWDCFIWRSEEFCNCWLLTQQHEGCREELNFFFHGHRETSKHEPMGFRCQTVHCTHRSVSWTLSSFYIFFIK